MCFSVTLTLLCPSTENLMNGCAGEQQLHREGIAESMRVCVFDLREGEYAVELAPQVSRAVMINEGSLQYTGSSVLCVYRNSRSELILSTSSAAASQIRSPE
jgi:hypothetical protein